MALLPVSEALARLLDGAQPSGSETVGLREAAGRVLAAPLHALRTQPPFAASAMDGYAVRADDIASLPARLSVIGEAPAGRQFTGTLAPGQAVRIFTGAPVPEGADTVVIQENVRDLGNGEIEVVEPTAPGRNIRAKGLDFRQGDLILDAGRVLDPAGLSLIAAANHPELQVAKAPLIAIIATGDELLPPGSNPGPGQIIASNAYGVAAIAESVGARVLDLGIAPDRTDAIATLVGKALDAQADVIVTLGGASVGDHDLVHRVLTGLGMDLDFWKIAMRPGKPLMFGRLGKTRCIGLPGNPVASLICAHIFLKPLLATLGGRPYSPDIRTGILDAAMTANDLRQDFVRALARETADGLVVTPYTIQDSSMLRTLADANCAIMRAPFAPAAERGNPCRVLMLR
ncbi:gephyrin-like molybdotransferase Glp [Aminobacter aganoensis]|uniref:Molybdopterin molybdenumtransferase n=1 Tax=Aminobacter aganoensis TaxID=83264 RepID=A0A7X0F3R0_9HYPH|nr:MULTISPECIES: gephyrin-like molybdotransferase Glp [Aminobacter]KQU69913.1 molybdenum cofactor biosynthesis protein MoaA [Aminobacter sp. DSM 101952]MBB6352541.1 molybdopterin molybdotransferase [Aminobacter aganoensis]